MRIAIVNDMSLAVESLRRVVLSVPEHEVCWIARDGADAVAKCGRDVPDLILMDLVMPVMDGVEATRKIMSLTPCAILVVTACVDNNASMVFQAMGAGALDAVDTPVLNNPADQSGAERLLAKIRMIGVLTSSRQRGMGRSERGVGLKPVSRKLVAIGASSGGPHAVAQILANLPEDFPAPVVIVQHVDKKFVQEMVRWLSTQTTIPIYLAKEGARPSDGNVYVACTNDHLVVDQKGCFAYTPEPREMPYRPSVDVFFNSLVENWRGSVLGVLLTGMGSDGASGLLNLRNHGWNTLAQDQASCAVWGMPKAAVEMNAAEETVSINKMGERITQLVRAGKDHDNE